MKKFHFSLQKVLQVRLAQQKQIQRELALALDRLHQAKQLEQQTLHHIDLLWKEKSSANGKPAHLVMTYYNYINSLEAFLDQHRQQMANQQDEIGKIRARLMHKAQERKILEKLKEKRYQAWHQDYKKKQQAFLDEVSGNRFARLAIAKNAGALP